MGRRNDDKLTGHQEDTADHAMRALLARRSQPKPLTPPPNLASRIMEQMPSVPPAAAAAAERRRSARRRITSWGSIGLLLLLGSLGAWGVLVDSNGPATLLGGPETTFGYVALVVTLAAKPIIALLLSVSAPLLLAGTVLALMVATLWWRLLARPLVLAPVERRP